jgi:DNA (cytosine-5)-methyltransferase 1
LDLFAGVGGSSSGARRAGARIVAAVDAWPLATETYRENFPDTRVFTRRLDKVPIRAFHESIGNIDLILASPECTNHTLAKGSGKRCEASRETALQVTRFAREFMPRWIVVENVTQMRQWRRYRTFVSGLEELGYQVREQVLNANDFGVPQDRRRLFIICDREIFPQKIVAVENGKRKSVKHVLDQNGSWKASSLFSDKRATNTIARYLTGLERMGEGKSFLLVYYGTDAGGGWQRLDRPLRTVTTVDRFALVKPNGGLPKMRMLQVPELKRAMGFGPGYRLNGGTRRDRIKLLGNAVCPPVMEAVVRAITAKRPRAERHENSRVRARSRSD